LVTCSLKLREESKITPKSLATVTDLISFPNNLTGGIDGRLLVNCGTPITRSLVLSDAQYNCHREVHSVVVLLHTPCQIEIYSNFVEQEVLNYFNHDLSIFNHEMGIPLNSKTNVKFPNSLRLPPASLQKQISNNYNT